MDETPPDPTPAKVVPESEVPRASRGNTGWAEYADGQWWQLNTVTNPLFHSITTQDQFSTARSFAHRHGMRFESRPGPLVRGVAPVIYYVRFTRKDSKA